MDDESKEILKKISMQLQGIGKTLGILIQTTDTASCLLATLNPHRELKKTGYQVLIPRFDLIKQCGRKNIDEFLKQIGVDFTDSM